MGPSRASGRGVSGQLMGTFMIFLPEEKKWEIQNHSFMNSLFNRSVGELFFSWGEVWDRSCESLQTRVVC